MLLSIVRRLQSLTFPHGFSTSFRENIRGKDILKNFCDRTIARKKEEYGNKEKEERKRGDKRLQGVWIA